ncbi:MAG: DUF2238 domain-containing protein [Anaeromyxobacter sp.]
MRRLLVLLTLAAAAACRRDPGPGGPLRLGHFPNLTHAQALAGVADGTLARAVDGRLQVRLFNAGPAEMEALLSGDLDVAYVGPGPAAIAYLRTHGEALRIIAGAASGGASLVVRAGVDSPAALRGQRVASPQLGNTQDVALRTWLHAQGLEDGEGPDQVRVTPLANADILSLFVRGQLAGAWVPEPWASRLVAEGRGRILVDERTLWPGGAFPTTVLVASTRALRERREDVRRLLQAHLALTARWAQDPRAFARAVNDGLQRAAGKRLPDEIVADAFTRLEPTRDAHAHTGGADGQARAGARVRPTRRAFGYGGRLPPPGARPPMTLTRLQAILLVAVLIVLAWSGVAPKERSTWWMEVAPGLVALPVLFATRKRFPLTPVLYVLIALHAMVLCVGGHWTYAEVPAGFWVKDVLGLSRNPYDRLGHLFQGFVPALVAREVLLRTSPLRRGGWLFTLVTSVALAISALYELVEWLAAVLLGAGADAFLGTQGDPWDTQWDMFMALCGALLAQLLLSRLQDRQLARLAAGPASAERAAA